MAVMRTAGIAAGLPPHAQVEESDDEYLIRLDVSDFEESALSVEVLGFRLTVRGDRLAGLTPEVEDAMSCLREHLEERFRLPDDAVPERIGIVYRGGELVISVPRATLAPVRLPIVHRRVGLIDPSAEAV